MREITNFMIKDFKIDKLGYDFMGGTFTNDKQLSFHHLLIPHRESKKYGIGDGYVYWNGAILRQDTTHDELHLIEHYDYDAFCYITSLMLDEKVLKRLDIETLRKIRSVLTSFEKEHCSTQNKKGQYIIKPKYINTRIKL